MMCKVLFDNKGEFHEGSYGWLYLTRYSGVHAYWFVGLSDYPADGSVHRSLYASRLRARPKPRCTSSILPSSRTTRLHKRVPEDAQVALLLRWCERQDGGKCYCTCQCYRRHSSKYCPQAGGPPAEIFQPMKGSGASSNEAHRHVGHGWVWLEAAHLRRCGS